jgi:hypothetical protein
MVKLPRHAEIWLAPYAADRLRRRINSTQIRRVWLAITDHWEPFWRGADFTTASARVRRWREIWPRIASQLKDSAGHAPKYSFFYPEEEYHPEFISALAEMTRDGVADVEVHIHHDGGGREEFTRRMTTFCRTLVEEHGLLRTVEGRIAFGFIHGNWALNNSRPDGRWCGLNDEIAILRDLGCYADFTMPSGNSPTQARTLNTIYWCRDDVHKPKSYDKGVPALVSGGTKPQLLMIPGPFGLRWRGRLIPRLETGELSAYDPPSPYRVHRWLDLAPQLGADLFLKLYSHGAQEANSEALLNRDLLNVYRWVADAAAQLHADTFFVSAWQMYLAISALCDGRDPLETSVTSETSSGRDNKTMEKPAVHRQLARISL